MSVGIFKNGKYNKVAGNAKDSTAANTTYNNGTSGLQANNVQSAIDELNSNLLTLNNNLTDEKAYLSVFSTTTSYGNYTAPFFINTKQKPTIKYAYTYNDVTATNITDEVFISDYNKNNFAIKCNNPVCNGCVIVITFD